MGEGRGPSSTLRLYTAGDECLRVVIVLLVGRCELILIGIVALVSTARTISEHPSIPPTVQVRTKKSYKFK
jgi:hypothetical protein